MPLLLQANTKVPFDRTVTGWSIPFFPGVPALFQLMADC